MNSGVFQESECWTKQMQSFEEPNVCQAKIKDDVESICTIIGNEKTLRLFEAIASSIDRTEE